jgi:hypothetical protein
VEENPASEHQRLAVLLGRWRTRGWTIETADTPALEIDAVDTYTWLPGRSGLLHVVDARVGDERVEGAEVIGWDPERRSYVTQYFGSDGPAAYEASLSEEDGALTWRMRRAADRFTGSFSDDGDRISGYWEQPDDEGRWQRWMEIELTRENDEQPKEGRPQ